RASAAGRRVPAVASAARPSFALRSHRQFTHHVPPTRGDPCSHPSPSATRSARPAGASPPGTSPTCSGSRNTSRRTRSPRTACAMASRQRELPVGSAHPPAAHAAGSPDAGSPDAGSPGPFVLADEFTATLDRPLAKVVAFNLRKLVSRTGVGVLAATTHEDVA